MTTFWQFVHSFGPQDRRILAAHIATMPYYERLRWIRPWQRHRASA